MSFQSERLTSAHELTSFRCGNTELDEWLVRFAEHAAAMRTAQTFVWADASRVVAYYSLAAHQVLKNALPTAFTRGSPNTIPAVLLCKLALDETLHQRGLGEELLVDALERVLAATEQVAARLVVVDAVDGDAARFYERYGFVLTASEGSRLVRKVSDIAADFGMK